MPVGWFLAAALLLASAVAGEDPVPWTVRVVPDPAPQGSLVQVIVRSLDGTAIHDVTAKRRRCQAAGFPWSSGEFRVLLPVGMEERPGPTQIHLDVTGRRGPRRSLEVPFTVAPGHFDTDALAVGRRFLSPTSAQRAQARSDTRAFDSLWERPPTPRQWRGNFATPLAHATHGFFGTYRTLNGSARSRHMGVDVVGATGDRVRAVNDGTVVMVRDTFYAGKAVVVDHGGSLFTLYFHLSAAQVELGQGVRKGQVLGRVGATGRVTGPHLHWGVRQGTLYVNPAALLGADFTGDPALSRRAGVAAGGRR